MNSEVSSQNPELDRILREVVTDRKFSELPYQDALAYLCRTLSEALSAARVGIWDLDKNGDAITSVLVWDARTGLDTGRATLTSADAKTYLDAVMRDVAVVINDAPNDPRCAELARKYLPATGVSALLDCPIRTMTGMAGVLCIEEVGGPRHWTAAEVSFAMAITGLVSLTVEHKKRLAAESAALDHERRLKVYTDLAMDWYWETDREFRFEALHGNASEDGRMPQDYLGMKLWDAPFLSPLGGDWSWLISRVEARKRIYDFIVSTKDELGETHYAELAGIPKHAPNGAFLGYWGTAKDVTRRVRHELELRDSERRYRSAVQLARLGSWLWDERTERCAYCSPELAEIYGVSAEEYVSRSNSIENDLRWFHPDDRDRYREEIAEAVRNQTGYDTIVRIVRDDGSVRTLHEITEAIFDDAGRFVATAGVLQDITDQVELQRQLKTHRDRLKNIVDHFPGAIYRVKYDAKFTSLYRSEAHARLFVDPAMADLDPTAPGEPQPLDIRDSDRARMDEILRKAVAAGQPYEMEYGITLRDGSQKWVSDRGRPVVTTDGSIELEGMLIDETEKHAAQEALAHGRRLEAIGKLTGGIAHDFNNLLAIVLGNLELLHDDLTAPDQLELLESGIDAVNRGAELTRNMLAFARKTDLTLEVLDPNTVAQKARSWVGRALPETITLELKLKPGLWRIEADAGAAESAILNLVINARDAMPDGGRLTIETANVEVDADSPEHRDDGVEPGRYAVLSVSDTGHGIPPDRLERIFEPFYTTKPPGAGSGLGLSMILGFMKQSGGAVRVTSETGAGTTFSLYFRAIDGDAEVAAGAEKAAPTAGRTGARILIAEDQPEILEIMRLTLTKAGHRVTVARSGDEALKIFKAGAEFDLLITDQVMPGALKGADLSKALRRQRPDLKVIFMTGYASKETLEGGGIRQDDIRLSKPVQRVELISAVDAALGRAIEKGR